MPATKFVGQAILPVAPFQAASPDNVRAWKPRGWSFEILLRSKMGQTFGFCRLLVRRLRWRALQLANRPEGRGFSTLSTERAVASHDRASSQICTNSRSRLKAGCSQDWLPHRFPLYLFAAALLSAQTNPVADGIAAFNRGDYKAARQNLERSPADPQARLFLALTKAATGECEAAVPDLTKGFSSGENRRLAGLALAQCHVAAKRFAEAGAIIAQLEKQFPADADVLYVSAGYHMKAWNDAIYRMYQKAPSSYRVDQLSAEVFETQGKYTEAVAEYRKAIEKNPKAINLHYRLGRALLQQSHDPAALEQARKEFAAELSLNPSDAVAEYQVAQVLTAEQKKPEAAAHFERAAELRPDFPEALIAVAKLRSDAKRYADAIALLERAVKLQPRNETAHYNLMMVYRSAGRPADAQREKAELEKLQKPPEGEFTDFLKRLGDGK